MPEQNRTPSIGEDVSHLFPVGADVTALMGGAPSPEAPSLIDRAKDFVVDAADTVIPLGLRVVGGVGGAIAGGAAGLAAGGVGAVPGALAGGVAGSALGETLAEGYEVMRGDRESLNPTQIAVQGALGAIPGFGKAPTVARGLLLRGGQGAVLGAGSDVVTRLAEGETPTLGGAATAAGLGAVLGGGIGALEGRAATRAATKPPAGGKWGTYNGKDLTEAEFMARQAQLNLDAMTAKPNGNGAHGAGGLLPATADLGDPNLRPAPLPVRETSKVGDDVTELFDLPMAAGAENLSAQASAPRPPMSGGGDGIDPPPAGPRPVQRGDEPPYERPLAHDRRSENLIEDIAQVRGEPIPAAKSIEPAKINPKEIMDTLPEETREGAFKIMEEKLGFRAQRRDVQPVARTQALSQYVQVDRARALPKGTALNDYQTAAYASAADETLTQIDDLAAKVAGGNATAWDVAALEKARREAVVLIASWRGAKAEAGRALNIHKYTDQVLRSHDELGVKAIEQALKNPKLRDNLDTFSKEWAALGGDPIKQVQYIRSKQEAGFMDKVSSVFYSGILSGPRTHVRNVLGNTVNQAFLAAAKGPAVLYDAARSAMTGEKRTMFFAEMKPAMVGSWVGLKQGAADFMFAMRHGFGRTTLDTFDVPRVELRGGGANPLNWTGRLLEAEDQFFRSVAYHQELASRTYAAARQEAMKKGLRGDALDRAIQTRMADMTLATPPDIEKAAAAAAKRAVFKEEPGGTVAAIQRLKGQHPWMNFVVPFVRTPAAILRQAVEATPAAMLSRQFRDAMQAGGRESAEAMGRVLAGTTALASLGMLAMQGKISGPGPSDMNQRTALYESGWRPNSILIGDTWVDYTQIQPLAQALFAVTAAADSYKQGKAVDPFIVTMHSLGAITDQSFLSGVSDLISAVDDADRYAQTYKEKLVTSGVPFGGLLRNVTQTLDPVVRDPKTVGESVQSILPGLSKGVAPKVSRFGEETVRPGSVLERGFSPVIRSPQSQDPIVLELNRLGITNIGTPDKKLDATVSPRLEAFELTADEQKLIGQEVKQALERIIAHEPYRQLDADRQRAVIGRVVSEARSRARTKIRAGRVRGASATR